MDDFTLGKIEFEQVRQILHRFCRCSLGRSAAEKVRPSTDLGEVRRRLEDTRQMLHAVRDIGLPPMAGATDITASMHRAQPGHGAGPDDFADIAATLDVAGNVRGFLESLPEELDALRHRAGGLADFQPEVDAIRDIIDNDGTVRPDASPRLRELRRDIDETSQRIHDIIRSYLRNPDVRKLLQQEVITLHGDRYVLPVRAENRGRLPGVVHRASNTGATVFVEPNASVELNNRLVDLHDHERQEIERLLTDLAVKISARRKEILRALDVLEEVDLLSAKAQYAYQFEMTCPEVTQKGPLEFFHARHPLLIEAEWQSEHEGLPADQRHGVVPIDVRLGSDFDILVVTGSNTGGKTVTLKTVALLAAMAQSGLHIPAQRGATMPLFTDVLIDIGDEQSLQQSLSTFGAHIERLKYILSRLQREGQSQLVLLDELGSGTDPDEGGAIGQAVLDELRRVGCLAIVTTHFSVLKAYAMNHERVDNASVEFNTQTLRPTYHLQIGTAGESHAITVAEKLGLPKRIVDAAREHLGRRGSAFRTALRKTGEARKDAEAARAEAAAAKVDAEQKAETLAAHTQDVEQLRQDVSAWLARLSEMKPGETLHIPSLKRSGSLVRLELHRQRALLEVDGIQREVPLIDLMPDVGQHAVRQDVAEWRRKSAEQAGEAERKLEEAEKLRQEAARLEEQQKQKARQFDTWLGAIARVKIGDEVPIARKPGQGVVKALDLRALKATVETGNGKTIDLSLQELFPQIGPFAPRGGKTKDASRRGGGKGQRSRRGRGKNQHKPDRPIPHVSADTKQASRNRQAVLNTLPGEKVYVVPFGKQATLVRIDEQKDQAVVQAGAFEMQVALSDVEPIRKPGKSGGSKPGRGKKA